MTTTADDDLDAAYVFSQLDNYPWTEDQEFQAGLRSIVGSVQDSSQVAHLTLRAKCYYFARKTGSTVDFNGYKRWLEDQSEEVEHPATNGMSVQQDSITQGTTLETAVPDTSGGMANAPKPASFSEICDMIAEGKPIPGIKDIPDVILEGQASESQTTKRKKPWEKEDEATETPSWLR